MLRTTQVEELKTDVFKSRVIYCTYVIQGLNNKIKNAAQSQQGVSVTQSPHWGVGITIQLY